MLHTLWGVVHDGKVELTEKVPLVEGSKVLVTFLPSDDEEQFWLRASESALDAVWDNPQDDVYAQLL